LCTNPLKDANDDTFTKGIIFGDVAFLVSNRWVWGS